MFDKNTYGGLDIDDTGPEFQRIAGEHSRAGLMCFVQAFSVGDAPNMKYRYTEAVKSRFAELAAELMQLVTCGGREVNPAYGEYLLSQKAKKDQAVQALIRKASRKTPIRKTGHLHRPGAAPNEG